MLRKANNIREKQKNLKQLFTKNISWQFFQCGVVKKILISDQRNFNNEEEILFLKIRVFRWSLASLAS